MKNKCNICKTNMEKIFNTKILNKYQIDYFHCSNCEFIQTEHPYWIEEVYKEPINTSDTGLITRNIYLSKLSTILIFLHFNRHAFFLDYAAGYGVFTRLMRDIGFDFLWHDPYTTNLFAKGFEWNQDKYKKIELLTTFESFEHLLDPIQELEKMLSISDNILFSTELVRQKDITDWWYLGTQHGQHISLYSEKTLRFLANKYNLNLYTNRTNIHLFTRKKKMVNIKFIQFLTKLKVYLLIKRGLISKTTSDSKLTEDKDCQ